MCEGLKIFRTLSNSVGTIKIPTDFTLMRGENPVWHGRRSLKLIGLLILLGFLALSIFGLGIILILYAILLFYSSEYLITNNRIYGRYGIIGGRVFEIKIEWIAGTSIRQSTVGRLLNYGRIILNVPGQDADTIFMDCVSDPEHIIKLIEYPKKKIQ
jgi:hypothetical protein